MWPTDTTYYLLLLGLAIPFYEITCVLRHGMQEATTMRFCGVIFLWIGYHLSPWLAYLGQPWTDFMLVPALLDRGLLFSSLCMGAFVFGHWFAMGGQRTWTRSSGRDLIGNYRISGAVLFAAVSVSVILFLTVIGGIGEAWRSSFARGAGQFAQRDFLGGILQMLTITQTVVAILGACLASLFLVAGKANALRTLGGLAALIAFSLSSMHGFSRGAGFAFFVLSLVAIYIKNLRGLPIAMLAIPVGLFLGSVAYNQRGNFYPGIASFMEAIPLQLETMMSYDEQRVVLEENREIFTNTLDAMGVWTRVAAVADDIRSDRFILAGNLALSLSPLPSEMVKLPTIGPELTEIMGTGTSVGLTTPALAQVYYALGLGGAGLMVVLGAIYGWFDRLRVVRPGSLAMICAFLCLASLAIGLHSNLRAMTRPLLYAFILYQGVSWLQHRTHTQTGGPPERRIT